MAPDLIHTIRWQDVLDVTLVSYILFRLYVIFKGTNVFRVLIGISILWFFQKIAFYAGLIVTSWAVQGFTAVAAIIIIVIFRNEIRSVLQAKNFKALFWDLPHQEVKTPIDILADSVFEMAVNGTGSIIVVPGKEDISDSVHSGLEWDGVISREMIKSIFWHDNPVHDGAIIVNGDRISQVGAVLPLSSRKDLPSFYGMRHRAAVGLSEVSDALIILSSEERKDVIAVKSNNIQKIMSRNKLIEIINEHLGISDDHSLAIKKENTELIMFAVFSFLFVTGIWLSFTRGANTLITLEVPVEYSNSNPQMIIMETSVKKIFIELNGSEALLRNVDPGQVKVSIDLSNGKIGENVFNITSDDITMPPGVFLRNTIPSSVKVSLDKVVSKSVPIQADWYGKLPDNIMISKVTISPDKALIKGPSLLLNKIYTVYTKRIPVNKIQKSGKMEVNLNVDNTVTVENGTDGQFLLDYTVTKIEKVETD